MMTAGHAASPLRRLEPIWLAASLLGIALATWLVLIQWMAGMDAGPGTNLGTFGWFFGVWLTMMAAMMLPAAAPMVLLFARVSQQRSVQGRASVPVWVFVLGYLAVWATFGVVAYGIYAVVAALEGGVLAWDRAGAYVAGGAVAAAGVYQLTPLKSICLRHCRGPMHFMLHRWREGRLGALRMGVDHGAYCVGCCWGLMLALFAVGVMSVFWMAAVTAAVFVEKGHSLRRPRVTGDRGRARRIWDLDRRFAGNSSGADRPARRVDDAERDDRRDVEGRGFRANGVRGHDRGVVGIRTRP